MATIVMESAKVIKAGQAVIDRILAHRETLDEQMIIERMTTRALGWRGFYYPTREQAIKLLDNSDCWGWRSISGWGDLAHARKLILMAQHGDPVTLDQDDISVLF
jgi:hypothetical protein